MTHAYVGGAPVSDDRQPWWANDPELAKIRRRTVEEFERAIEQRDPLPPDGPDQVVVDVLSGASWRELAAARDNLSTARARYEDAVRAARAAGFSWAEIGRVLGVSKQQLHRRFRTSSG